MKKKTIIIIILLSTSSYVFGRSGGVGNGGDALICGDSITLLDRYEAEKIGLEMDLSNENIESSTHRTMISVAVNRLSKKDKYTAKKLYDYSMEMVSDFEYFKLFPSATGKNRGKSVYLSSDVVGEISDSKHRTLPKGCELRQLVSQQSVKRTILNRYEINKTLWDQLSVLDQSMTILHEAWYRIMIEDGATDSVGTRYMNGLIASTSFENYKFSDYIVDLQSTEKKHYIIENNSSLVFDSLFKVNLKNKDLEFKEDTICTRSLNVKANIKRLVMLTTFHRGLAGIDFKNVCFNNSIIKSLTLPLKFSKKRINFVMENYLIRTNGFNGKNGVIKFNENGTFKELLNLNIAAVYKMFYKCGKRKNKFETFEKQDNCKGPYLLDKTKISKPKNLIFDENEVPLKYKFPSTIN